MQNGWINLNIKMCKCGIANTSTDPIKIGSAPSAIEDNDNTSIQGVSDIECVCVLEFYVLATSKVISGRVPTCDSVHSWRFYSAATLGDQINQHHDPISLSTTISSP